MESQMKVQKLERDMPKFLRAQRNYLKEFESEEKRINRTAAEAMGLTTDEFLKKHDEKQDEWLYKPEDIEDLYYKTKWDEEEHSLDKYQPVLY